MISALSFAATAAILTYLALNKNYNDTMRMMIYLNALGALFFAADAFLVLMSIPLTWLHHAGNAAWLLLAALMAIKSYKEGIL